MGGADIIMATAPNSKAISSLIGGLGVNGNLLVLAATLDPIKGNTSAADYGQKFHSWLAQWNSKRFGRYAAV